MRSKPASILMIDDDDVVIMGLQRALKKMNFGNPSYVAANGLEALSMLRGKNGGAPMMTPCMILLDLNMPCMNGFEFLDEVRNDPDLRQSIIFVLTTSDSEIDKKRAYDRNVAGYIVKPDATGTFSQTLELLERYQNVVDLPC